MKGLIMKIGSVQNFNYKNSFGTKLTFRDDKKEFNSRQLLEIEKSFEQDTKNIPGTLAVMRKESKVEPDYYYFVYQNGDHIDSMSGFISSTMPKTINGISDKLLQFLEGFLRRENKINEMKKTAEELDIISKADFNKIADIKSINIKKAKIDF